MRLAGLTSTFNFYIDSKAVYRAMHLILVYPRPMAIYLCLRRASLRRYCCCYQTTHSKKAIGIVSIFALWVSITRCIAVLAPPCPLAFNYMYAVVAGLNPSSNVSQGKSRACDAASSPIKQQWSNNTLYSVCKGNIRNANACVASASCYHIMLLLR